MYNLETVRNCLRICGLEITEFQSTLEHGVVPEITIRCHPIFTPFQPETTRKERSVKRFAQLRILKSGIATIVFWQDGTKTVVKRGSDEPESDYAAFTAALGIKIFGSNSALKRIVSRAETQEPKAKNNESDR